MHINFLAVLLIVLNLTDVWTQQKELLVLGSKLEFLYSNSKLGNKKSIPIEFGKESSIIKYWIKDLPLKVITHGYIASDMFDNGVFDIKKAYVNKGGYNVISVDWSKYGRLDYSVAASLTKYVGYRIAEFLDRIVNITGINASNIHLIGHSLGAHVVGSCGSHFKSGKIGRITGLDPARPEFEILNVINLNRHLSQNDAMFVDVIHSAGGTLGYSMPIGHVDFFPNGGFSPQPGCVLLMTICSHLRSYELFADSIYHERSLLATECVSWPQFKSKKCSDNKKVAMGDGTISSARGTFYLKTRGREPYGIE